MSIFKEICKGTTRTGQLLGIGLILFILSPVIIVLAILAIPVLSILGLFYES